MGVIQMQDILNAISTVGFPIVVAMYSLMRLEQTVKVNSALMTQVLEKLTVLPIKEAESK